MAWVFGAFAVATFLLAPQLLVVAAESRRRGLLNQPVVVQASALGGLIGGVIGLVFRPEHYPTAGFFAVTVLVVPGRRSYRRTQQNVVLAFVFNAVGVPLAATGLFYPIWAMVVMIVSVTAVLANSMRGKWSMMFSTLRDVAQVYHASPTASA